MFFKITYALALSLYAAFLIANIDILGVGNEEIASYLERYPKVVTEIRETGRDVEIKTIAPDYSDNDSLLIKSPVWPVVSYVWKGFRIPLFMDPQGGALIDNLFLPIRILFPYNLTAVRIISALYLLVLLMCFFLIEINLIRPREILGSAAFMMLHPAILFIFSYANREETAVILLSYLAIRSLCVFEATSDRKWIVLSFLFLGCATSSKLHALPFLLPGFLYFFTQRREAFQALKKSFAPAAICFAIPVIPHFLLCCFGGFSSINLNLADNLLKFPTQVLNAVQCYFAVIVAPEDVIGKMFMNNGSFRFTSLYSILSFAAIIYAFAAAFKEWKARRRSHSTPVSAEEIFVILSLTALAGYILIYTAKLQYQAFFFTMPFFFLILARFISKTTSFFLKNKHRATKLEPAIFATVVIALIVSLASSDAKMFYMWKHPLNPMFNLRAEKNVVEFLKKTPDGRIFTTTQNHCGFPEFLSSGSIEPYHLYNLLNPWSGISYKDIFRLTLSGEEAKYYLFDKEKNIFTGFGVTSDNLLRNFLEAAEDMRCDVSIVKKIPGIDGKIIYNIYKADCANQKINRRSSK